VFATVLGALQRPPAAVGDDDAVRAILAIQDAAGLEPLTDGGRWRGDADPLVERLLGGKGAGAGAVEAWRFAVSCTERAVKAVLPGPFSLAPGDEPRAMALAEAINEEARALVAAGAPLIEIEEPAAATIGEDERARSRFREVHRRLTAGLEGTHLTLAIVGGNADRAGATTFLDAPYSSYAFDLRAGPDNWRLVADIPADRGVICGALSPLPGSDDGPELLVWAAHYASSTGRRGLERVGLANAPGLDALDVATLQRKLNRLGEAARLAASQGSGELAEALDPRAINIRSAAAGRFVPGGPRARKGRPAR
jgi:methionine synthase II (cobalamin-independent)